MNVAFGTCEYVERIEGTRGGGEAMLYATAHEYNLTFRCINCGRYEASANYSSDEVVPVDEIKARIYRVRCTVCGWKGEACGVAAIRILRCKRAGPDEMLCDCGHPRKLHARSLRGDYPCRFRGANSDEACRCNAFTITLNHLSWRVIEADIANVART
jgi:hypothetical protein